MLESYQRYTQLRFSMPGESILMLELNRPDKKNAIGLDMTFELADAFDQIARDSRARVLVLTGSAGNFSTGMDMKDFFDAGGGGPERLEQAKKLTHEIRAHLVRNLPQPTIALVEGYCLGGAISLVESCDMALCADDAVFGLPEINFGFFPGGAVAKALMQKMTKRWFSYYALSGRTFDGEQAARCGLVTRSVPPTLLRDEGLALANEIAKKDPVALELTKDAILHVESLSWDGVWSYHAAKLMEMKRRQVGATSRAEQVRSFLAGESKPGSASAKK